MSARRAIALIRVAVLAGALAALLVAAAPARAEVLVSLGDSYSSGEGARDRTNPTWDEPTWTGRLHAIPGNGCHRSPNAWPRLLGVTAGRHLACSGAEILHVIARGQKTRAPDHVAQLTRLRMLDAALEIETVLLTIGGNDLGFARKIKACFLWPRCLRDPAKLDRELDDLKPRLVHAYGEVADATRGNLVVVGYPEIFPSSDETFHGCGWLSRSEKKGVWRLQDGLARTIAAAAREADVAFISIRDALDGRELCTEDSALNKIMITTRKDPAHPTATGQRLIAGAVSRGIAALGL